MNFFSMRNFMFANVMIKPIISFFTLECFYDLISANFFIYSVGKRNRVSRKPWSTVKNVLHSSQHMLAGLLKRVLKFTSNMGPARVLGSVTVSTSKITPLCKRQKKIIEIRSSLLSLRAHPSLRLKR